MITLLLIAFLAGWTWLVALVCLIMAVGTWWPELGLFKLFYQRVLRPAGLLKPDPQPDSPQPHLFAQGVGALFLAAATLSFAAQAVLLGWVLAWIVIVLATVNLVFGFCVGCFVYYQLQRRLGITVTLPMWKRA
ncbi:MAG: DUF4395 domain-containing protein [Chloroflexi bacterium]|nr:DUF4395 domain-containing protein [Chloroflexota bacterium]